MTRPVTLAEAREALKAQLETSTARCRALNVVDEALAHVEQAALDPDEALDVLRELIMPARAQPVSAALLRELEPLTPARQNGPTIDVHVDAIDPVLMRQAVEREILPRLPELLRANHEIPPDGHPSFREALVHRLTQESAAVPSAEVMTTSADAPPDPRRDLDADQVLLDALATGHKTLTQLGKVAKKRGELLKKAIDRTHYRLQRLIAECKVLRIQRGLYALVPPPPRPSPTSRPDPGFEVAWNGSMKTPLPGCSGGHLGSSLSAEAGLIR